MYIVMQAIVAYSSRASFYNAHTILRMTLAIMVLYAYEYTVPLVVEHSTYAIPCLDRASPVVIVSLRPSGLDS